MFSQFFGFRGRIGRGTWWIAHITLFLAAVAMNFLLSDVSESIKAAAKIYPPDKEVLAATLTQAGGIMVLLVVWGTLAQWIFLSTNIQRLHDRGSSGWRILFAYAPILLLCIAGFLVVRGDWAAAGVAAVMSVGSFFLSSIWTLIECGMLPGEDCENDYGDPPGEAARALALQQELAEMRGEPIVAQHTAIAAPAPFAMPQRSGNTAQPSFGRR